MKKNLIIILLIVVAVAFIGCKTEPEPCNLGAHLGIGETCTGTSCTLQDYNTSTGPNAFPKPIYRVGAVSNFDANVLAKTVDDIMTTYTNPSLLGMDQASKNRISERLLHVEIYKAGGNYTWKNKVLGLLAGLDAGLIYVNIGNIASPGNLTPTAQVLTTNIIH